MLVLQVIRMLDKVSRPQGQCGARGPVSGRVRWQLGVNYHHCGEGAGRPTLTTYILTPIRLVPECCITARGLVLSVSQ